MKESPKIPLEKEECKTFAKWLEWQGVMFSHIANELYTNNWKIRGARMAMGVKTGVPDYVIVLPQGLLFIEMKRQKGSATSKTQKEWIAALNKIPNVQANVCKGASEAIELVQRILKLPR